MMMAWIPSLISQRPQIDAKAELLWLFQYLPPFEKAAGCWEAR